MVQPKGQPVEAHDSASGAVLWTWPDRWWPFDTGGGVLLIDHETAHLVDPRMRVDRARAKLAEGSVVGASAGFVYTKVHGAPRLNRTSLKDGSQSVVASDMSPVKSTLGLGKPTFGLGKHDRRDVLPSTHRCRCMALSGITP